MTTMIMMIMMIMIMIMLIKTLFQNKKCIYLN